MDCSALTEETCTRESGCRWADLTGDDNVFECVSSNCRSIELSFDLPSPYGCPPEFCSLDGFRCINKRLLDIIVDGVFIAEEGGKFSIRYLFWIFFLCLVILLILLKFPRILGYIVGKMINFFFLRRKDDMKYPSAISIGSVSVAILGGKIRVQDVEYMSVDNHVKLVEGIVSFKWWLPLSYVRRSVSKHVADLEEFKLSAKKPCRLNIYLKGIEISIYNNSKRYSDLQAVFQGPRNDFDTSSKESQAKEYLQSLLTNSVPWVYNWIPTTSTSISSLSVTLFEPRLPTKLVLFVNKGSFIHFAMEIPKDQPNAQVDCYRVKNNVFLDSVVLKSRVNKNFKGVNSLQASLTEVLVGNTKKQSNAEGGINILGVMKEFVSYVKDIFDEEIMFTPPDFSVGLTGAEFQENQKRVQKEIDEDDSESDDGNSFENTLSRNSSFLQLWKNQLPATVRKTKINEKKAKFIGSKIKDRCFTCLRFVSCGLLKKRTPKQRRKSSVFINEKLENDNSQHEEVPLLFETDSVFINCTIDIPGQSRSALEIEDFTGFPVFEIKVEVGSESKPTKLEYGPWMNMIRRIFQDRFLPDTFQVPVYNFFGEALRERHELKFELVTKSNTLIRIPYRGREPESLLSDTTLSYRSRSTLESARLYESLIEPLEHLRHGKEKEGRPKKVVVQFAETHELLNDIFADRPDILHGDLTGLAVNNIEWLTSLSEVSLIPDYRSFLKGLLLDGWLVHQSVSELINLREFYLTSRNLSKVSLQGEKDSLRSLRFYQASLINVCHSILEHIAELGDSSQVEKEEIFKKFTMLPAADLMSITSSSEELAKLFWKAYVGQELLLLKELNSIKKLVNKVSFRTLGAALKKLSLSPAFEERLSSSKFWKKAVYAKPGSEISFLVKARKKAKKYKKFSAEFVILDKTIPVIQQATSRLPRWLNIFDTRVDNKSQTLNFKPIIDTKAEVLKEKMRSKRPYDMFLGPQGYASSTNTVCKFFEVEVKEGSEFNFILPFSSLDKVSTVSLFHCNFKDSTIFSSQTNSVFLKSKSLTFKVEQIVPVKRHEPSVTNFDLHFATVDIYFLREHEFALNQLLVDWQETSQLINLRSYNSPETFIPEIYQLRVRSIETGIHFNINEKNVVDFTDDVNENLSLKLYVPEIKFDMNLDFIEFESPNSIMEWNLDCKGNEEWKSPIAVYLVYPKYHPNNDMKFCKTRHYKARRKQRFIPLSKAIFNVTSASFKARHATTQIVGTSKFKKVLDIKISSDKASIVLLPETLFAIKNFVENYISTSLFTINSTDFAVCRNKNLRSALGSKLYLEAISKINPAANITASIETDVLQVFVPLSTVPKFGHSGLLKKKASCVRFFSKGVNFSFVSSPNKHTKWATTFAPISMEVPESKSLGTSTVPDKAGNFTVSMQETKRSNTAEEHSTLETPDEFTQTVQEIKSLRQGKGVFILQSLSISSSSQYAPAALPKEQAIYVVYSKTIEVLVGSLKGSLSLAQLYGLSSGISSFQINHARVYSGESSVGGFSSQTEIINMSQDLSMSYKSIVSKGLSENFFTLKGYIGTLVLHLPKDSALKQNKYSCTIRYGSKVFKSDAKFLSDSHTIDFNTTFSFNCSEIKQLVLYVFVEINGIQRCVGKVVYSKSSIQSCVSRNTAKLGVLVDVSGLNSGQLKNSAKWSFLRYTKTSSVSFSSCSLSDIQATKLNKLNSARPYPEVPLYVVFPNKPNYIALAEFSSQRRSPFRILLSLAACEISGSSATSENTVLDDELYRTRCFRFSSNMCFQKINTGFGHIRYDSKSLEPSERLAQVTEGSKILRRISNYERLPNASQTLALSLYADEAFDVVSTEYCNKKYHGAVGVVKFSIWSPLMSSVVEIKLNDNKILASNNTNPHKGMVVKLVNEYSLELLVLELREVNKNHYGPLGSNSRQRRHILHGQELSVISQFKLISNFIFEGNHRTELTNRRIAFLDKLCQRKKEKVVMPRPTVRKKLSARRSNIKVESDPDMEAPSEEQMQVHETDQIEQVLLEVVDDVESTESFTSANECKTEELRRVFSHMACLPHKKEVFISVSDPLPLSPGDDGKESDFFSQLLPRVLVVTENFTTAEASLPVENNLMDMHAWTNYTRDKSTEWSSTTLPSFEFLTSELDVGKSKSLSISSNRQVAEDDQSETSFIKIKLMAIGYTTAAVINYLDEFFLVSKPVTPNLDQVFDAIFIKRLFKSVNTSAVGLNNLGLEILVDSVNLNILQAVPRNVNNVSQNCIYRALFNANDVYFKTRVQRANVSMLMSCASMSSNVLALGTDVSINSLRWMSLGTIKLTSSTFSFDLPRSCDHIKTDDSERNMRSFKVLKAFVAEVSCDIGSDFLCAFHSMCLRWVEEGLDCYETSKAASFRHEQQQAMLIGQVVRLLYSVNHTVLTSSAHVKEIRRQVASQSWNEYYANLEENLPIWDVLTRLKLLLKVIPDHGKLERVLSTVPFDRHGDVNPIPTEYLADVVFLKNYFATASQDQQAESAFVNDLLQGSRGKQKGKRGFIPVTLYFSVDTFDVSIRALTKAASPDLQKITSDNNVLLKRAGNTSMNFVTKRLYLLWKMEVTDQNVAKIVTYQKVSKVSIRANPLLLQFALTALQVNKSVQSFLHAYRKLILVHAKYHDTVITNWRNDLEPYSTNFEKPEGRDREGSVVSQLGETNNAESQRKISEDTESDSANTLGWDKLKHQRLIKANQLWNKVSNSSASPSFENFGTSLKESNSSELEDKIELKPPKIRVRRAETLLVGKKRNLSKGRFSYEESDLERLLPTAQSKARVKTKKNVEGLAKRYQAYRTTVISNLDISKISIVLGTAIPGLTLQDFNPLLRLTLKNSRLNFATYESGKQSNVKQSFLHNLQLKQALSLNSSQLKVRFGQGKASDVADVSWIIKDIGFNISEGKMVQDPRVFTLDQVWELRVLINIKESLLDLSNWQMSVKQLKSFLLQWRGIYKEFFLQSDSNKAFIARQDFFYKAIRAEETKIYSDKDLKQEQEPVSWRNLRQNVYKAAKTTTASMERYIVDGLNMKMKKLRTVINATISSGRIKLSPKPGVSIELSIHKVQFNFDKEVQKSIEGLVWIGSSTFSLKKESNKDGILLNVIDQELPGFWLQQKVFMKDFMRTTTGRKVYDFDLRFIMQCITSEFDPGIVYSIVSLQGDLAEEILESLATLSRLVNQWKNQDIAQVAANTLVNTKKVDDSTTESQETTSGSVAAKVVVPERGRRGSNSIFEGTRNYRFLFYLEGIKVKASCKKKEKEISNTWINADTGGIQLALEWLPTQVANESLVIKLTKCNLLFEGMKLQVYAPELNVLPLLFAEASIVIEQTDLEVPTTLTPAGVKGISMIIKDFIFETQPNYRFMFNEIILAYVKAFQSYNQLLEEKMKVVNSQKHIKIKRRPKYNAGNLTEKIMLSLSNIWQNIREPLGRQIDNAANHFEDIYFLILFENLKGSFVCGFPSEDDGDKPGFLVYATSLKLEGCIKLKDEQFVFTESVEAEILDQSWRYAVLHTTFILEQLSVKPCFVPQFPFYPSDSLRSELVSETQLRSNLLQIREVSLGMKMSRKESALVSNISSPQIELDEEFLKVVKGFYSFVSTDLSARLDESGLQGSVHKEKDEGGVFTFYRKFSLKIGAGTCDIMCKETNEKLDSLPLPEVEILCQRKSGIETSYESKVTLKTETFSVSPSAILYFHALVKARKSGKPFERNQNVKLTLVTKRRKFPKVHVLFEIQPFHILFYPTPDTSEVVQVKFSDCFQASLLVSQNLNHINFVLLLERFSLSLGHNKSPVFDIILYNSKFICSTVNMISSFRVQVKELVSSCDLWKITNLQNFITGLKAGISKVPIFLKSDGFEQDSYSDIFFAMLPFGTFENEFRGKRIKDIDINKFRAKGSLGSCEMNFELLLFGLSLRKVLQTNNSYFYYSAKTCLLSLSGVLHGSLSLDHSFTGYVKVTEKFKSNLEEFALPFVTAEQLIHHGKECNIPLTTYQQFLYKKASLIIFSVFAPSVKLKLSVLNKKLNKQIPLVELTIDKFCWNNEEKYSNKMFYLSTESSVKATMFDMDITIDSIANIRFIFKSLHDLYRTTTDGIFTNTKAEKSLIASKLKHLGTVDFDIDIVKVSLLNGVSANMISIAAVSFEFEKLKVLISNLFEDNSSTDDKVFVLDADKSKKNKRHTLDRLKQLLDINFKSASIVRYQQILEVAAAKGLKYISESDSVGTNQSPRRRSTLGLTLRRLGQHKPKVIEKTGLNRSKRREKVVMKFPQTNIKLDTVRNIRTRKILVPSAYKKLTQIKLSAMVQYKFFTDFQKNINVSTDLRDYTYLKQILKSFYAKAFSAAEPEDYSEQRSLLHKQVSDVSVLEGLNIADGEQVAASKASESEQSQHSKLQFARMGVPYDFVFKPKLNVIGDATNLALNMLLSKLDINKNSIPKYLYESTSFPVDLILAVIGFLDRKKELLLK